MNPLAHLKTLLPLSAAGGALLASLVAVVPSTQAGTAAYYAATEILPPADYTSSDRLVVVAVNKQGYVLLRDQGTDRRIFVYKSGQLITLADLATVGYISPVNLSSTAADGSFNVVGEADFSDGFHRVIFWHVNADGTSTAQMMQNRILPENSQQPGEQHSASPVAVNNAGVIAGNVQSYLAGLGAFWYPPTLRRRATSSVPGTDRPRRRGQLQRRRNANGGNVAQYNNQNLSLPTNIDSRTHALKNGLIVGEYLTPAPEYKDVQFVYNVATQTFATLPLIDNSANASNQDINILGYHGEVAGEANGNAAVYTNGAIWLPDATTGAYSVYNLENDIIHPVYTGYDITSDGPVFHAVVGFADDGSMVVQGLTNRYTDGKQGHIMIFKPGADLRPKIVAPDPTYPGEIFLHAEPGQPFSYQFVATNNPTAFRLVDTSDATKDATLPDGLSFNKTTGLLSGTGPALGTVYFSVQATNGQGIGAIKSFAVLTSGDAPMITSASTATAHLNQPFTFQVTATNEPTNFYFTGLPDGLVYDYGSGLISGTPTKAGTFPVAETVNNAISGGFSTTAAGTGTLTITVDDKPPAAFTVSLTKPADEQNVIAGTAIKAKAKVDLTNAGAETVASLTFLLDGKPVGDTLTAKPYKAVIPLDGSLSGAHTLTVTATANDGRTAVSAPLTVNVAARFVDLGGSSTLKPKIGPDGSVTIKGQYTLSNSGNTAAGPFVVGFYISNDATFDSGDQSLDALATPYLGKNPGFDQTIPGLPANTTVSSSDLDSILPKLKIKFTPPLAALYAQLRGKYLLTVIDPGNTAGESADTRANNVVAYPIP